MYNTVNLLYNWCRNLGFELDLVCMNIFNSESLRATATNFSDDISYFIARRI